MTSDTRDRIRAAALGEFCDKGYGACVDDIARRAGVVKQTLYHHYGSKDALFREALIGLAEELFVDLESSSGSLREDLLRFGESFRAKTLSEQGVALTRMIISEAPRFPELSRTVFEAGDLASRSLARRLQQAMARGELREDDAVFAAEMLLGLLGGKERDQLLFGITPDSARQRGRVERIVDCFLQAYAPGTPACQKGS
jgi:AcrR family transcriptional regulator